MTQPLCHPGEPPDNDDQFPWIRHGRKHLLHRYGVQYRLRKNPRSVHPDGTIAPHGWYLSSTGATTGPDFSRAWCARTLDAAVRNANTMIGTADLRATGSPEDASREQPS